MVEICSEAKFQSGHSFDSQETISDNVLYLEFYENETPKNFDLDVLQRPSIGFPGNLELVNTNCYLESRESHVYSSDSNVSSSPAMFDSNSQIKKKQKVSKAISVSDDFNRTETNLRRSDRYDPHSKFVSGTAMSENLLTIYD